MRRFCVLIPLLVLLLAGSQSAVASHSGTVVLVDGSDATADTGGCGDAANPCNTIQAGVDHAASGDTVQVAAGTYTEQVTVSKSVTLDGAGSSGSTVKAPATLTGDASGMKNIITVTGASVAAEITGFTIDGPGPGGCGSLNVGVMVRDGANADIHDNTISNIRDEPISGCQNGQGIWVGRAFASTTGTATITNNVISGYQKGGIVVDNAGSSATITGNTVTGVGPVDFIAQNGIQVSRGATATVNENTVTGNSYTSGSDIATGILLFKAGDATAIGSNTVSGNEVGLWTSVQATLGTITLSGISGNGRNAVADYDGGFPGDSLNEYPAWPAPTATFAASGLTGTSDGDGGDVIPLGGGLRVIGWNAFTAIQPAINAVATAGTVNVAAGTYNEGVTVGKALTLSGPNAGSSGTGSRVAEAIVNTSATTFLVTAAGVAIDGFQISGDFGVYVTAPGSLTVANNRITGTTRALSLEGSGNGASILSNDLVSNVRSLHVSGPGPYGNLAINGNRFSGSAVTGIFFLGNVPVNGFEFKGNQVEHLANIASTITNGEVSSNTFAVAFGTAYNLAIVLHDSELSGNTFNGFGVRACLNLRGILFGLPASTNVTVTGNSFTDCNSYAMLFGRDVDQITVTGNTVTNAFNAFTTIGDDAAPGETGNGPFDATGKDIHVNQNSITGSTNSGFSPGSGMIGTLDFTQNWWGSTSGPGSLSGANATPWCTNVSCSALSNNADLASLGISPGTLSPAFSAATTAYTASVDNSVTSVTVSASANPGAGVATSGNTGLAVGSNTVTVTVTSADGTVTKTYTVTVTRAAAPTPMPTPEPTPEPTPTPVPDQPQSAPATPASPGSVTAVVTTPSGEAKAISVDWPAGAFTAPVTVTVTPTPATAVTPTSSGFTVGGAVIRLDIRTESGEPVTSFAEPLVIRFPASSDTVPAYSADGTNWTPIPRIFFRELPAGQSDGYFVNPDGSIDVFTRHATFFGLLKDVEAPTAPEFRIRVTKTTLRLSWRGMKDNVRIFGYVVNKNGHGYRATKRTILVLPRQTGRFKVAVLDTAGNVRVSKTVRVVRQKQRFVIANR